MAKKISLTLIIVSLAANVVFLQQAIEKYLKQELHLVPMFSLFALSSAVVTLGAWYFWNRADKKVKV